MIPLQNKKEEATVNKQELKIASLLYIVCGLSSSYFVKFILLHKEIIKDLQKQRE
jgi:hypothetical protein